MYRLYQQDVSDMLTKKDEAVLQHLFLRDVWSRSGPKGQLGLEAELFIVLLVQMPILLVLMTNTYEFLLLLANS